MTKYVVSGYIGFDNFGDEAIAHVLVDQLKKNGAEKITLISSHPEKTKILHDVDSCGMFNFFNSVKNSDILISGGGSLLQDVTSLKSLLYYLTVILTALLLGKKVEIYAQGIGPIQSFWGKLLTKLALKNADKISVRDKKSLELLDSWGIKSELVKDPIFSLELQKKNNKGTVGIQLRQFKGINSSFLEKLADEIKNNFSDKKIEILSLQDSIDLPICKLFQTILKRKGIESEIYSGLSINEVISKITNLEYLIAMRFHANVLGIKSGVKTLAVSYDPKVEKLAEEYNLPCINLNDNIFKYEFEKLIK